MRLPRFKRHQDKVALGVVAFVLAAAGALYLALMVSK